MPADELKAVPLRVLLVEDNPEDAFLIERHLRRNGFQPTLERVETSSEMRAALEGKTPPDVILADYNLPEFSGPAALALLKSMRLDIPFIMMSGVVTEETAVSSLRAGAQDYIGKQNLSRLAPAIERELAEAPGRRREQAAQQALLASESRFDRLVAGMPLGLLIFNAQHRIVYANQAIEVMLQHVPGSLRTGECGLADVFSDPSVIASSSQAQPRSQQEPLFEATCLLADGKGLEVLVGLTVLNPEDQAEDRRVAVFVADISMRKKSEEMLRRTEKLAVAGRLAAVIAHEVNNPLEAITNCLYLVGQCELPENARTFLQTAQSELDRVSQITVQTLRFHRSSTHPRSTDVHELIESVLSLLASRFAKQGVSVERRLGDVPRFIVHDGEIRHLITNLLTNAIDAMPRGGRILVRTRPATDPATGDAAVQLTIADHGAGMDAETRQRLFEPFYSTKGITGTGLGLWVSRGIVDKHGGSIRFRSREAGEVRSGGTIVHVLIPLELKTKPMIAETFGLSVFQ